MNPSSDSRLTGLLRWTCAAFVVFFGLWTVLANAVVLSGRTFIDLLRLAPLVVVAGAVGLYLLRPPHGVGASGDRSPDEPPAAETRQRTIFLQLLIAAAIAAVFAFGDRFLVFWVLAVGYLGYFYVRQWMGRMFRARPPATQAWNLWFVAAAALLALLATVLLNRPNVDQTLNLNMAVSVLDEPASPIFRSDSLHGLAGAYFIPPYRAHSFELLGAWMAPALNIGEPIVAFHLILAPLLSLLSVCAAALCFRVLLPRHWGLATLVLTVVLLVMRQTYTTYGSFAYLRMFEGKSVFVTALIPLIVTYAVDFFDRPDLRKWFLLMLAQIAAVGLTANALYSAPMAAGLALAACWRPSVEATRRAGLGLTSAIYPVAVGLIIRAAFYREDLVAGLESFEDPVAIHAAVRLVLGDGLTLWLWLLALVGSWSVVRDPVVRRWVLAFSLGFMLIAMNPFLGTLWGSNVTAQYLTWRLLWVIPLPVFLTVFVIEALGGSFRARWAGRGVAVLVVSAVGLALVVDQPWTDSLSIGIRLGIKVPQPDYAVAQLLSEVAGKGRPVLAPERVSIWVPTLRDHAYPLVARRHYSKGIVAVFGERVDAQDLRERLALMDYITGDAYEEDAPALLERWLRNNKIEAIAAPQDHPQLGLLSTMIQEAGFTASEYAGYVIFEQGR